MDSKDARVMRKSLFGKRRKKQEVKPELKGRRQGQIGIDISGIDKQSQKNILEALRKEKADVFLVKQDEERERMGPLEVWNNAFLAMAKAVDGFLLEQGCPKPKSMGERFSYLYDLESKNPEIADLGEQLASRFTMHQVCFAESREEFAEEEIRKTLEIIRSITKRGKGLNES